MRNNKRLLSFYFLSVCLLIACKNQQTNETREDFKQFYDKYQVTGSFVLYDQNADKYLFYHPSQFKETFTPASTFKICNALIGLETNVIPDENFIIHWDSIPRNPVWDKDHDLQSAYKNSTVWYFQEIAKQVGGNRMKFWLDKTNYGNTDTTGGIDKFWLEGGLRISPEQQIDFLKKLHDNKLPFSERTANIVKK